MFIAKFLRKKKIGPNRKRIYTRAAFLKLWVATPNGVAKLNVGVGKI